MENKRATVPLKPARTLPSWSSVSLCPHRHQGRAGFGFIGAFVQEMDAEFLPATLGGVQDAMIFNVMHHREQANATSIRQLQDVNDAMGRYDFRCQSRVCQRNCCCFATNRTVTLLEHEL